MKISILFLSLVFSFSGFAQKVNVLSVWNTRGTRQVTPALLYEGMNLALKKFDNKINLIPVDTDGTYRNVQEEVNKAIEKYKPVLIVGAITSNMALFISQIAESRKIPFITPFATLPEVTKNKTYTFRTCWNDIQQADILLQLIKEDQKLKSGVILFNAFHSYSIGLKNQFLGAASRYGVKIADIFEFKDSKDITPEIIKKINDYKVDFIFLPTYQVEAASIIKNLANKLSSETRYIGGDSWGGGRLFHNRIAELPTKLHGFYVQHYSSESKDEANLKFLSQLDEKALYEKFNKTHKISSTAMRAPIAIGYDLIRFSIKALSSKSSLIDSIKNTSLNGATGSMKLGKENTPISKPIHVYKISNDGEKYYKTIRPKI